MIFLISSLLNTGNSFLFIFSIASNAAFSACSDLTNAKFSLVLNGVPVPIDLDALSVFDGLVFSGWFSEANSW